MHEIYRKRGTVVRYENGVLVRVTEAGEAIEADGVFRARPLRDASRLQHVDGGAVHDVAREVHSLAGRGVSIERLILTDGHAEHEFGARTWSDDSRRMHAAFVSGTRRMLIDEGTFQLEALPELLAGFAAMESEREAPARIRLAPRVMAALTFPLLAVGAPNVSFEQLEGGVDGKGVEVRASSGVWPNWYRPSYRVRPLRMPFHLAARCSVTEIEHDLPRAVALLAPPAGLTVHVLCRDAGVVYPTTIRVIRIDAITEPVHWFPFAAGVWAGEAEVVTSR